MVGCLSIAPVCIFVGNCSCKTKMPATRKVTPSPMIAQPGPAVLTMPESIAWLLNIRGSDVERTPVALSFVIAHADGTAELFINADKVTPELRAHLGNAVTIRPYAAFEPQLKALSEKKVAVDPERAVQAIFAALAEAGAEIVELRDPCVLAKAVKNPVEQAGHRAAHISDFLDQPCAGDPNQQIGGKEAELHQHRLGVVQCEQFF